MLFNGFNTVCKNIAAIFLKVGDDSMSAISFRKMAKGNLPHFSYTFFNLDPLGTEFNTVAFSDIGVLLLIEFQRFEEGMKHIKYHKELG